MIEFNPLNKAINPYAFPGIMFDLVGGKKEFYIFSDEGEVSEVVVDSILEVFKLTIKQVRERNRKKDIRQCRQFIHFFLRKYTKRSLSDIGAETHRDHSTVLHSCKTILNDLEREVDVKKYYDKIEFTIKEKANKKGITYSDETNTNN